MERIVKHEVENEDSNDKKLITYIKKADKTLHKITIPVLFRQLNGDKYYMDVYRDKIVITPFEEKEEEK